jgi:hypothetical protein
MWSFAFISFFIVFATAVMLNWIFFDLLIKIQCRRFHFDWVKDGKPIGIFHKPPDAPTFIGSIRRDRLLKRWIFQKPGWVEKDKKAARFYKYFRATGIICLLLILSVFVSFIIIFLIQP